MSGTLHDEYWYGMRHRGFSPGCQPKDGLVRCATRELCGTELANRYFDILIYSRQLTRTELRQYELDEL